MPIPLSGLIVRPSPPHRGPKVKSTMLEQLTLLIAVASLSL